MTIGSKMPSVLVVALCVILSFPLAGDAKISDKTFRGYVLDVLADGSFRLDDGVLILISPDTVIRDGRRVTKMLPKIGWEVEAKGEFDEALGVLRAKEVIFKRTKFSGKVKGTAIVEAVKVESERVLLLADGRQLQLSESTVLKVFKADSVNSGSGEKDFVHSGDRITYRGSWTNAGVVEVGELSVGPNLLEEKEKEFYRKFAPVILMPENSSAGGALLQVGENRYRIFNDNQLQLYADRIGKRLVPAFLRNAKEQESRGVRFWFQVVSGAEPRAVAFPGGVVVISTGLIRFAESEAQVAFVIAHEIAHVVQEHGWLAQTHHKSKLRFLRWATAGVGYLAEAMIRKGYNRELEDQADRLALWYIKEAGYDHREAARFLLKLDGHIQEIMTMGLFDSHRTVRSRREAIGRYLSQYSSKGHNFKELERNSQEFQSIQARIPSVRIVKGQTERVEQD